MNLYGLIWPIGLSVIGIIGIFMAGRGSAWGWFIGLSAQVLWIIFAITTGQYGFILSAFAYGSVYAINWRKWRRERLREQAQPAK